MTDQQEREALSLQVLYGIALQHPGAAEREAATRHMQVLHDGIAARATIPQGMRMVPVEPTEEMWSGLARSIMLSLDMGKNPTGEYIHSTLRSLGHEIPSWFEAEIPNINHVPSKGARVVAIYKAMLAAAPQQPAEKG